MKLLRRAACCAACAGCCVAMISAGAYGQRTGAVSSSSVRARPSVYLSPAGAVRAPGVTGPRFQTTVPPGKSRPDLEPARIAGETLAGAYAGIAGYFLGSWSVGTIADMTELSDGMKDHLGFAGGVLGAGAATAASVWAIGNIGDQTGSFPIAVAGTAAGVAVGILLNQVVYGHARLPSEGESSRMRWVEASLEAMLPSIGATIAFNSTRRYK